MDINTKLKSILEGTYVEEVALTTTEADELYSLKADVESERKALIFTKDPTERAARNSRIHSLEERIQELRAKALKR